ncbi:hypothetical protein SEA_CROSBY_66 [Streptomyces phage Crosby]|nr:hypothetical protein SEA_CROSBY_66 [Streptomyces phage Crosby]
MSEIEIPEFAGIVDTEQTITRYIRLADAGDDRFDLVAQYRDHKIRPSEISITYRVNRGADVPFWYVFEIRVYGYKVLKSGKPSTNRVNRSKNSYHERGAHRVPEWAAKIAKDRMPTVPTEV